MNERETRRKLEPFFSRMLRISLLFIRSFLSLSRFLSPTSFFLFSSHIVNPSWLFTVHWAHTLDYITRTIFHIALYTRYVCSYLGRYSVWGWIFRLNDLKRTCRSLFVCNTFYTYTFYVIYILHLKYIHTYTYVHNLYIYRSLGLR